MPLKLTNKAAEGAQAITGATPLATPTQETAPTPSSSGFPKISFKRKDTDSTLVAPPPTTSAAEAPAEKQKKKPGRKPKQKTDADGEAPAKQKPGRKRKAADDGDAKDTPSVKKAKGGMLRLSLNTNQTARPQPHASASSFSKIRIKSAKPEKAGLSKFRIKHVGTVPQRPVGVGYDSEDEDAEEDPAIEHQLVLRMPPGDDCRYLARMLEEKKVGLKPSDGGADISFIWLDKDARRSMWTIRGNKYAGALFDLPTITEVFKTWNKKDILKVTDISQILIILGRVNSEQEAREYPLPAEVDKERWEYPHGLTPPMKFVRKRRFRKRINYRDIDSIEAQVQKLLEDDKRCIESGGDVTFHYVDPDAPEESDLPAGGDDEDAEGEEYEEYGDAYEDEQGGDGEGEALFGDEENEHDMAAEFMAGLGDVGDEDEMDTTDTAPTVETAAAHALAQAQGTPSAANTPSASAEASSDAGDDAGDDYEGEDDEGEDDEELDDDAMAARQEREQQIEEFETLKKSLGEAKATLANTTNVLLRNRNQKRVEQLQNEVDLKQAALGIEDDG